MYLCVFIYIFELTLLLKYRLLEAYYILYYRLHNIISSHSPKMGMNCLKIYNLRGHRVNTKFTNPNFSRRSDAIGLRLKPHIQNSVDASKS